MHLASHLSDSLGIQDTFSLYLYISLCLCIYVTVSLCLCLSLYLYISLCLCIYVTVSLYLCLSLCLCVISKSLRFERTEHLCFPPFWLTQAWRNYFFFLSLCLSIISNTLKFESLCFPLFSISLAWRCFYFYDLFIYNFQLTEVLKDWALLFSPFLAPTELVDTLCVCLCLFVCL